VCICVKKLLFFVGLFCKRDSLPLHMCARESVCMCVRVCVCVCVRMCVIIVDYVHRYCALILVLPYVCVCVNFCCCCVGLFCKKTRCHSIIQVSFVASLFQKSRSFFQKRPTTTIVTLLDSFSDMWGSFATLDLAFADT